MLINLVLRGELSYFESTTAHTSPQTKGRFLVGFADDPDVDIEARYGDLIVDELELWFQDRDTLLAFGYIERGQTKRLAIFHC